MKSRSQVMFLGLSALTGALVVGSVTEGCQSGGTGTGGAGGTGTTNSTNSTSTNPPDTSTSGTTNPTTSTTNSTTSTGGGMMTTVHDITTGAVGQKVAVELKGVVATSHIFLVSQSSTSNSCLWGVFVSDPITGEAQANSGILVVSYGTMATVNDGGTKAFCPVPGPNGTAPTGSAIPDDTAPGDVLDVIGQSDKFVLSSCGSKPNETTIGQFQVSKTTMVTKTGTATPPTPHVLTDSELTTLAAQTDQTFYDKWGGVKLAAKNVTSVPQASGDAGTNSITDGFGNIFLMGSNAQVSDKVYYQGLLAKNDVCHKGPVYANATTTFTEIDAPLYLNFCTWSLVPTNRCKDFNPASDDCAGATCQ